MMEYINTAKKKKKGHMRINIFLRCWLHTSYTYRVAVPMSIVYDLRDQ